MLLLAIDRGGEEERERRAREPKRREREEFDFFLFSFHSKKLECFHCSPPPPKNYILFFSRISTIMAAVYAAAAGVGIASLGIASLFREYEPLKCESVVWGDLLSKTPSQKGKTIAITGTTSGTGLALAKGFAEKGAKVLMLNRKSERSEKALEEVIRVGRANGAPDAVNIDCDLQKFSSVRKAIEEVKKNADVLDVLCNNAGIMALPFKGTEENGFDQQMQVNCLSHFLLTQGVFPLLLKSKDARIVNHSSVAANTNGEFDLKSLEKHPECSKHYNSLWQMYSQTKLANIVFTKALDSRLRKKKITNVKALVAHPGFAATSLQTTHAKSGGRFNHFVMNLIKPFFQSAEDGAAGILLCSSSMDVESGNFYGPAQGMRGKGFPVSHEPKAKPITEEMMDKFWEKHEECVGARFEI